MPFAQPAGWGWGEPRPGARPRPPPHQAPPSSPPAAGARVPGRHKESFVWAAHDCSPLCGNRAASHYQALGGGIKGRCRGRCPPDGPTWPPTLGHSFRPGQGLREPRSGREPDGGWGVVWRGPGREPPPPPAPSAQVTAPASALGVNVLRGTARRRGCGLPCRGPPPLPESHRGAALGSGAPSLHVLWHQVSPCPEETWPTCSTPHRPGITHGKPEPPAFPTRGSSASISRAHMTLLSQVLGHVEIKASPPLRPGAPWARARTCR